MTQKQPSKKRELRALADRQTQTRQAKFAILEPRSGVGTEVRRRAATTARGLRGALVPSAGPGVVEANDD